MDSEEKALREGMTKKMVKFCEEYMVDLNASQAIVRAGYSDKNTDVTGAQNLVKPSIARYIAYLREKQTKRTEIDADYIIKGLKSVADRCSDGSTFEHAGANRAFELMGKHLGMFTDKVEVSGQLDLSGKTDEQLREMLKDDQG